MFSKKTFLLVLLFLAASLVRAQEKVLLRYSNGAKALTGNCTFYLNSGAPTSLGSELYGRYLTESLNSHKAPDTAEVQDADEPLRNDWFGYHRSNLSYSNHVDVMELLKSLCLSCNGLVTVYYPQGQPSAVLSFEAGIPSGPYTAYYPNGGMMTRTTLMRGMPSGTWERFYKSGGKFVTGGFKPYPDSLLQSFLQASLYPPEVGRKSFSQQWNYSPKTGFTSSGLRSDVGTEHQALEQMFRHFDELLLSVAAMGIKDGAFQVYYRNQKKRADMQFSDEVRTGTWAYWDSTGRLLTKLHYGMGELKKVTDFSGKEYTVEAYTALYEKLVEEAKAKAEKAEKARLSKAGVVVDGPPPPQFDIFTSVELMPDPGFHVPRYISDNLQYPPNARKAGLEGLVVVKFFVDAEGRINNPVVDKSVSPELDAEALRLIRAMPRWKPGKQNGKPVPVYYRVPVKFSLE